MQEKVDLLPFLALSAPTTPASPSRCSPRSATRADRRSRSPSSPSCSISPRAPPPGQVIARIGFALIIGGALGNLIDRAVYGHVIDYVLFHTPVWSFAVFNLADAFITVGAVLVVVEELLVWRKSRKQRRTLRTIDRAGRRPHSRQASRSHRESERCPKTSRRSSISRDADKKQSVGDHRADRSRPDGRRRHRRGRMRRRSTTRTGWRSPARRRSCAASRWCPGIDFAGTVIASSHPDWRPATRSSSTAGASARRITAPMPAAPASRATGWCRCPTGMTPRDAMAIGTAGYTAMLCGHGAGAPRHHARIAARWSSPALPAASARWRSRCCRSSATTSSPRPAGRRRATILKELGAAEIISRDELSGPAKPLAKERWAGGVDAVGSHTLANVLSMTSYGGAVAACGLAQRHGPAGERRAVHPARRLAARHRFGDGAEGAAAGSMAAASATDLDHGKLAALSTTIGFDDIIDAASDIVEGKIRGRVVVEM